MSSYLVQSKAIRATNYSNAVTAFNARTLQTYIDLITANVASGGTGITINIPLCYENFVCATVNTMVQNTKDLLEQLEGVMIIECQSPEFPGVTTSIKCIYYDVDPNPPPSFP